MHLVAYLISRGNGHLSGRAFSLSRILHRVPPTPRGEIRHGTVRNRSDPWCVHMPVSRVLLISPCLSQKVVRSGTGSWRISTLMFGGKKVGSGCAQSGSPRSASHFRDLHLEPPHPGALSPGPLGVVATSGISILNPPSPYSPPTKVIKALKRGRSSARTHDHQAVVEQRWLARASARSSNHQEP
mgnify:CR=1 FL=1